MNQTLVAWLTAKGFTNVTIDGPWITWVNKAGQTRCASINEMADEFRSGK